MSTETHCEAYRGTVLDPDPHVDAGMRQLDDMIVVLDGRGRVETVAGADNVKKGPDFAYAGFGLGVGETMEGPDVLFHGKPLRSTQNVIMPPLADTHSHAFQPPGIDGELIRQGRNGLEGWLPTTLREGELPAKRNTDTAFFMASERLRALAVNGTGFAVEWGTSSIMAAENVLTLAHDIGLRVQTCFVGMDQGIDEICKGLQAGAIEILRATRELLKTHGAEKVFACDRFPLACSSELRVSLARLAREAGLRYEVHVDETALEGRMTARAYDGRSTVRVLLDDGVFYCGSRVGLAHGIHTSQRDMDKVGDCVSSGNRSVFLRLCPGSNAALGSHFNGDGSYVQMPLMSWIKRGVIPTLGTDQGAGRSPNLFGEMVAERGRHPSAVKPSAVDLVRWGTVNGVASMGLDPEIVRLWPGRPANLIVVKMAGAQTYYENDAAHRGDMERTCMRTIEGGQDPQNVLAMYVDGIKVK